MKRTDEIRRLLSNGVSKDPLMIHGTGEQAIFHLALTGKLPTGVLDTDNYSDFRKDCLYFTPNADRLRDKYKLESNAAQCLEISKGYANSTAPEAYMCEKLGCQKSSTFKLVRNLSDGSIGWEEFQEGLMNDGIGASLRKIRSLYEMSRKMRGVIVEASEKILDEPIEVIDEDILAVKCIKGLDIECISGIELLGPVEAKHMERFLKGNLTYKPFSTRG
jgi:hypothetical protein